MNRHDLASVAALELDPALDRLRRRLHDLGAQAREIPGGSALAARIDRAEATASTSPASTRPLVFALLGATGVGKSSLFNALVGREASPTSDVERCYTRRPYVVASTAARPLVGFLERHAPVWVDDVPSQFPSVLIDTPDIDGMLRENREVTRAVLEETDVVVFVTDPDRRANLVPLQEVASWAGRRHWVFVLNKADQVRDVGDVRRDWDDRLRSAGFDPDDATRLVVSVRGPEPHDLERLRRLVLEPRTIEDRRLIWLRNLAGGYQHALAESLIEPIRKQAAELEVLEREHLADVRNSYRSALASPLVSAALTRYLRDRTWMAAAGQGTGLLAPAIWLRARFAAVSQSLAIARLTRGSLIGLAAAAAAAAIETLRGLAGLRRALDLMGPELRTRLEAIGRTARRQVEDRGLSSLIDEPAVAAPTAAATAAAGPETTMPVHVTAGPLNLDLPPGGTIMQSLERLGLVRTSAADDVLAELYGQTERLAAEGAAWSVGWVWTILGNLLPLAALGHVLYRIGWAWVTAEYLPLAFYLMALAVFGAALLPGYALIASRIARANRRIDIEAIVSHIHAPSILSPLRQARERLDRFVATRDALAGELDDLRQRLPHDPETSRLAVSSDGARAPAVVSATS